jgi:hypothetical protein
MTTKYEHTQKAGMPFYAVLAMSFVLVATFSINEFSSAAILLLVVCLWLYLLLMMSSLKVMIDEQFLRLRFGPGVFFKKFPVSDITGIGPKYKTYIWGWGIRWYFVGWLYNIAGFDSVEIILKNGKKARIGTDEPEVLSQAIREAIA